ncbi:hypothetical protein B0H10DRAFT_2013663 [Mycena sp. CBHHK59/15]|nr:hypothetical protein B0H10DRAFT_2013663 [Mycena sp. CBHHK59/15]
MVQNRRRIEPRIGSVRVMSRFSVDSGPRIGSESKPESTMNRARIDNSDFPYCPSAGHGTRSRIRKRGKNCGGRR